MKKILALALCAFMMVAMIASVSATDYILDYNFEDDFEGDWIAVDKSITVAPKQFSIQVVKFDNTMCMKFDRQNYDAAGNGSDSFSDLMGGNLSTWGLVGKFVMSYDVYFEKLESTEGSVPAWQVSMLRMAPASGTQFQHAAMVMGNKLVAYDQQDQELMDIETGKWYNFAVAYDMDNKCFDVYVDGVMVAEALDWTVNDTSANDGTQIRIGWNGNGDQTYNGTAYVDNIKFYLGEKPENATGEKAETTAPETAAPETTAAATDAATTDNTASTGSATATADVAVVLAAISAIAASGVVVLKKRK